jgi:molybdate transport system substrate-binding protein
LALVVAADGKAPLSAPKDLLRPEIKRLALAQPDTVPAGIYAKKYLQAEGLWNGVAGKVIPVANVRAALASVEAGNVDAAFVYKTDAAISARVRVVYEVPADKAPEIIYPVAMTKHSKNRAPAREFLSFLSGPSGKAVFREYGFIVIE